MKVSGPSIFVLWRRGGVSPGEAQGREVVDDFLSCVDRRGINEGGGRLPGFYDAAHEGSDLGSFWCGFAV